jgi:hypothetical protein
MASLDFTVLHEPSPMTALTQRIVSKIEAAGQLIRIVRPARG